MYFVDLPPTIENAITVAIVAAVWFVIKFIIARVPFLKFLENYADEWGMFAAVFVIGWLENALPAAYSDISILAIQLVLAVIAVIFGLDKFLGQRKVKGFISKR